MSYATPRPLGVFTRNHREYLTEAMALWQDDPCRPITFRAASKWASAARAVNDGASLPTYISAIGSSATVEYAADLCAVHIDPRPGDPKAEALLGHCLPSTAGEDLWQEYGKRVRTLYVLMNGRRLADPFPVSELRKVSDGEGISPEYKYSYAVVSPLAWTWREAPVDRSGDHLEIRHGAVADGWDQWLPVALVGRPQAKIFPVQLLVDERITRQVLAAVMKELDFYLVDKREHDPWAYAIAHCGTAANIYSTVHWAFHPRAAAD